MARHNPKSGPTPSRPTEDTASRAGTSSPRRRWPLAAGLALLILLVATTATGAASKAYSIVYGDTLNQIAADHGTDVATLVGLNNLNDPDTIIAGDELLVPDGELTTYTIREGDTLADIAAAYGVSVNELAAVNKIENADLISVGQALLIYMPADTGEETSAANADSAAVADDSGASTKATAEDAVAETEIAADTAVTSDASEASTGDEAASADGSQSGRLHLVSAGETLADVAEKYQVTVEQLIAANALDSSEITAGMILKIPLASSAGVELIGMPTGKEQWPLMSELAAASIATAYWGEPVSADQLLESLDRSENPHLGFRGNPQGMFGTTENYGVYNGPLADALAAYGFTADPFYADGDRSALTSRIDAGLPVVVWVTFNLEIQDRIIVDSDLGRYSLVAGQHAVLVYGYDDEGVRVMDVSTGSSAIWNWDDFMASWSLFDGMGLAIELQ